MKNVGVNIFDKNNNLIAIDKLNKFEKGIKEETSNVLGRAKRSYLNSIEITSFCEFY